jgi:hypothetical protein
VIPTDDTESGMIACQRLAVLRSVIDISAWLEEQSRHAKDMAGGHRCVRAGQLQQQ